MSPPFATTRMVQFCETDAGGIMHFTNYVRFMEQAEHAMLRSVGLRVVADPTDASARMGCKISWPRVSVDCRYERPARFEQVLTIACGVESLGTKSVGYRFVFTYQDAPIATGEIKAVCCRICPNQPLESINIPPDWRAKLTTLLWTPA